ncbi:MAG TPA: NADH-quinone oxidoreductase subunit J [Vicinamibacteria bacterium]|nr:NADH-quinone oxidoreductase subunit J [Vicinamibacteria bacterium]
MSLELFHAILFYMFAAVAVGAALVMVVQRNPTYSAFALIVTLVSLAGVFGLLGSTFIAVLQIVVYAGAIMVLFLFVLMLLNVKVELRGEGEGRVFMLVAIALGAVLAGEVGSVLVAVRTPVAPAFDASARAVARLLFERHYLYVFEATSILILASLVGAIALAKRDPHP